MNRQDFIKALGTQLYPSLRDLGFKGSGATLRLIDGPVAQVFEVQGSSGGAGCYVNLGVHLEPFPNANGDPYDLNNIGSTSCLFNTRLRPVASWREWQARTDRTAANPETWTYGATVGELEASIRGLTASWEERGVHYFQRLRNYPADFRSVVANIDYTGYAERYDAYALDHLGFTALIRLAEHFDLPDQQHIIEAEAALYRDEQAALRAALLKKRLGK